MNKHKPLDRRKISTPVTPKEKEFNTWYVINMIRLCLTCTLDNDNNIENTTYYPFNSVIEYERAKIETIKLLSQGKELESKLLVVANRRY